MRILLAENDMSAENLAENHAQANQANVRSNLRSILEARDGWEVCAEARTGAEALVCARQFRPDVAILDLDLPGMSGFEVASQIKNSLPGIELVLLTSRASTASLSQVTALGAVGFVLRTDADHDLVAAVEAVRRKELYLSRRLDALFPNSPRVMSFEMFLSKCGLPEYGDHASGNLAASGR